MSGLQAANNQASAITENSTLLSPPRAREEQARAFIVGRGSTAYTNDDIALIVSYYWRFAVPAGLDPLLAIAQCIQETSDQGHPISSWWSRRPRRNPAGIGVTGASRTTNPNDPHNWAPDPPEQPVRWRAGLSFPTWEVAVKTQLGRLLAYAIPAGQGTNAQKDLINFALNERPLPAALRGTAPTLKPLGARHNPTGNGWAAPGVQYGARIADIARAIAATVA
jgi:hypothetical protein